MSDSTDAPWITHRVFNQPAPLAGRNPYDDPVLAEAVAREGADAAAASLRAFGERLADPQCDEWAMLANRYPPELLTHDARGVRRDEVRFHPAWHELLTLSVAQGLHASPWTDATPGAHVARAAGFFMMAQVEIGHLCPISMSFSAWPALRHQPELLAQWRAGLASLEYDPRFAPAPSKRGVLMGMGMTEKQGGSDLRANTTRAAPEGAPGAGRAYRVTGHKWFLSAPMCDAFLVLAQTDEGPTCLLLPRWTPEGQLNGLRLQRLKDKLGNRSNASSEVEFRDALGWAVGEPGRGIRVLIDMATYTRLDCALGSAGMMRRALAEALHHARRRNAFGKPLVEQPLMAAVLADLSLESEAATVLALRLARAFDAGDDPAEAALRRLLTPAAKFWVCKRAVPFAAEAMEAIGGSGYVEERPLARIYREMPVNSIWEGSGNVMCLDVLRALSREPGTAAALADELAAARGADRRLDRAIDGLSATLEDTEAQGEAFARAGVQRLVLTLQAALLSRHAPAAVADAFIASRLGEGGPGGVCGALTSAVDTAALLKRLPEGPGR